MQQNEHSKYLPPIPQAQSQMSQTYLSYLTQQQLQIIENVQNFMQSNTADTEQKLKKSNWKDMYGIIISPYTDNNIKIVCCSALKWLIFHKKYVDNPHKVFKSFLQFYMINYNPTTYTPNKPQQIVQIILKTIPNTYLNTKQKHKLIQQLLQQINININNTPKIVKIITLLIQQEQAEHINNETIAKPLLLFLQQLLQLQIDPILKSFIFKLSFILIQNIIDVINDQEQTQANIVQQFLSSSITAKKILTKIIFEGSSEQIVTNNKVLNQVKLIALELYSSIWIYYVDQNMFKICLNSIVTGNHILYDEQSEIVSKIVSLVQRSISQESYYNLLYTNVQSISVALLRYLSITPPFQNLIESDPQQYIDIQEDLCMTQQTDHLVTKVCSLISNLCLNIDGYMTFIGMVCVMVVKAWGSGLKEVDKGLQYMENLNSFWNADLQEKVGICSLVICSLSDQFEKRLDLTKPLAAELQKIVNNFDIQNCKIPPYLLCRFMLLYTYMSHPKHLSIFFPYSQKSPLYTYQLQSCYKILLKYSSKHPQYKQYITLLSTIILQTDKLTPALQNQIISGDLNNQEIIWKIFEKLIQWLDKAINKSDPIISSKISNLIKVIIDRMEIKDYTIGQGIVWGYLSPLWKKQGKQADEAEQFLIQIAVAYIKRFPNIQSNHDKLVFFLNIGQKTILRNKTLSSCLDLFFQLTRYLSSDLLYPLIQTYIKCSQNQQNQQQDLYECYYGLQTCMIRLKQLSQHPPTIDILSIINNLSIFRSQTLKVRVQMLSFSYIMCTSPPISPILSNINLNLQIPIYQTKPYCLYLFSVCSYICNNATTARNLLTLIIQLLTKQKAITNLLKKYQEQIYTQNASQCQLNAYSIYMRLPHPFLTNNQDIYTRFRSCWQNYPYKAQILSTMPSPQKQKIQDLYQMWKGNKKIRKIFKVKIDTDNTSNTMNQETYFDNKNSQQQ